MVFSSVGFLFFFLPAVLWVYHLVPRRAKNLVLLFASLIFYTWGAGSLTLILLTSITANYLVGNSIERAMAQNKARAGSLVAGGRRGLECQPSRLFQVRRVRVRFGREPARHLRYRCCASPRDPSADNSNLILHVPLPELPHRHLPRHGTPSRQPDRLRPLHHILSTTDRRTDRSISRDPATSSSLVRKRPIGSLMASTGSGMASSRRSSSPIRSAPAVNAVFATPTDQLNTMNAVFGVVGFAIQLYFDFSGYTDMALGIAEMFGIRLPENFDRPYSSRSITEFWRRWHMSLSRWFRDYLYIPLGGNRGTERQTYRNYHRIPRDRLVARRELDVHRLGRLPWYPAADRAAKGHRTRTAGGAERHSRAGTNDRPRALRLDSQVSRPGVCDRVHGRDVPSEWMIFAGDASSSRSNGDDGVDYRGTIGVGSEGLGHGSASGVSFCGYLAGTLRFATATVTMPIALVLLIAGSFSPFLYFQF